MTSVILLILKRGELELANLLPSKPLCCKLTKTVAQTSHSLTLNRYTLPSGTCLHVFAHEGSSFPDLSVRELVDEALRRKHLVSDHEE